MTQAQKPIQYPVNQPLKHDGVLVRQGTIELTAAQAKPLLEQGLIGKPDTRKKTES